MLPSSSKLLRRAAAALLFRPNYQPQGLRLAVVLQHLGKAEHAAGRQEDAVAHLSEA